MWARGNNYFGTESGSGVLGKEQQAPTSPYQLGVWGAL